MTVEQLILEQLKQILMSTDAALITQREILEELRNQGMIEDRR